jgi:hypothetical protein
MLCLAAESCCCVGPSISASRMLVMHSHNIIPDPCDNRLIRLSNCLQAAACVCDMASVVMRDLRHCREGMRNLADCVAYCTLGCMVSQVLNELHKREGQQYQPIDQQYQRPQSVMSEPIERDRVYSRDYSNKFAV